MKKLTFNPCGKKRNDAKERPQYDAAGCERHYDASERVLTHLSLSTSGSQILVTMARRSCFLENEMENFIKDARTRGRQSFSEPYPGTGKK